MKGLELTRRPPPSVPTPAELEAIRGRIAEGIFLGGNYSDAYDQFLIAHRDRSALLLLIDELQDELRHQVRR